MNLIVEQGDLFQISNEKNYNGWVLAHCISADFSLGLGIALLFDKRYKMGNRLRSNYTLNGNVPNCIKVDNVYNLVTKHKYWHKPTYQTLEGSLLLLKEQMLENKDTNVAMPMIGCGLDKLQKGKVLEILKEVFKDTDFEIRVRLI